MARAGSYLQVKVLSALSLLVLTTGFFSARGFFMEPEAQVIQSPVKRDPANFSTNDTPVAAGTGPEAGLEVLDWSCAEFKTEPEIRSSHIRLRSKNCGKKLSQVLEVKNLSNGFTASLFNMEKGFSTDFIDLKEGENRLLIRYKDSKSLIQEREIKVKRLPATSSTAN